MSSPAPSTETPRRAAPGRARVLGMFGLLAAVVIVAVLAGLLPRLARQKTVAAAGEETARRPVVNVSTAVPAPARSDVDLPATLQPLVESPIFARTDGYLRTRLVDIGDRVRTGQVLAEIETPELDQQIQQARATLAESQTSLQELQANVVLAEANLRLARITNDRWQELAAQGVLPKQQADEKQAALDVNKASVDAARAKIGSMQEVVRGNEANVRRLQELKSFARIVAPFGGVITARNVDVGTLINAGNGGSAHEMFRISQTQILRIFVNVPQAYVDSVRTGLDAKLHVAEIPAQTFAARVTRISNELDAGSRSMLAILEVPNPRGILLPGMYSDVQFQVPRQSHGVLVPGDAIVTGRDGTRVATVDASSTVRYRQVHIAHDFGANIEVDTGVQPGETVVRNPGDEVRDGVMVEARQDKQKSTGR